MAPRNIFVSIRMQQKTNKLLSEKKVTTGWGKKWAKQTQTIYYKSKKFDLKWKDERID